MAGCATRCPRPCRLPYRSRNGVFHTCRFLIGQQSRSVHRCCVRCRIPYRAFVIILANVQVIPCCESCCYAVIYVLTEICKPLFLKLRPFPERPEGFFVDKVLSGLLARGQTRSRFCFPAGRRFHYPVLLASFRMQIQGWFHTLLLFQ